MDTSTILVTGGCGFIGSNFVRVWMETYPQSTVINLDKLTYAGNPANLQDIADNPRYHFVQGDICDRQILQTLMEQHHPELLVHFAAETHVDRSLGDPDAFLQTNVMGTHTLLESAVKHHLKKVVFVSTDEVYGSIESGAFYENSLLMPTSPYSASKAGGDRLAYSYWAQFQLPVVITRASNNFGPYQYPEKVIPLFVTNALDDQPLPLYGDGKNVRDWLFVEDHCRAIMFLLERGVSGEVYNVGGGNELENINLTRMILKLLNKPESLIQRVSDRPAHDRRYALDTSKLAQLGFTPQADFDIQLEATVRWYHDHRQWWEPIKSGAYRQYYQQMYQTRLESDHD